MFRFYFLAAQSVYFLGWDNGLIYNHEMDRGPASGHLPRIALLEGGLGQCKEFGKNRVLYVNV